MVSRSCALTVLVAAASVPLASAAPFCRQVKLEIESMDLGEAMRRLEAKVGFLGNQHKSTIHPHVQCQVARVSRSSPAPGGADPQPGQCMHDFGRPYGNRYDYFEKEPSWNIFFKPETPKSEMFDFDQARGIVRFLKPWTLESSDPHGRSELQCYIHPRYATIYRVGSFRVALTEDRGWRDTDVRGILDPRWNLDYRGDGLGHMWRRWRRDVRERRDGAPKYSPSIVKVKEAELEGPTIDYVAGDVVGKLKFRVSCVDTDAEAKRPRGGGGDDGAGRNKLMKQQQQHPARISGQHKTFTDHGQCPLVFAHRALVDPSTGQENSLAAMETSHRLGLDGVEIDVFFTDTGLVVTHDSDLKRQYAIDNEVTEVMNNGHRKLLQELTGCEMFPSLHSFLKSAKKANMLVDIELKPETPSVNPLSKYAEQMGAAVRSAVHSLNMADKVVVIAIDSAKLEHINMAGVSPIRVGLARHTGIAARMLSAAEVLRRNIPDGVPTADVGHYPLVTAETVRAAHAAGNIAGAYTLYDLNELSYKTGADPNETGESFTPETVRRIIESGVDWIESDDPVKLLVDVQRNCFDARTAGADGSSADVPAEDPNGDGFKRKAIEQK
jgi:glycerophosphoryl diester phosphodiesterase